MKTAIVYISVHHGNTKKVVDAMAQECGAQLFDLAAGEEIDLTGYDLVGLASGVFYWKMHPKLLKFAQTAQFTPGQRVFLVSTCGAPFGVYTGALKKALNDRGTRLVGSFTCRGFDTYGPFAKIGGIAKGRPNGDDLARARKFVRSVNNL